MRPAKFPKPFRFSDQNWWRGQLVRGGNPGLFPSSFITMDLSVPDDTASVAETIRNEPIVHKQPPARIDEAVIKRCIELLVSICFSQMSGNVVFEIFLGEELLCR